jgi:hypothetical protein
MTVDDFLLAARDLIQQDPGQRGLGRVVGDNLLTACPDDFAAACRSVAHHPAPVVGVVTGFFIPHATPPAAETDGPLGALFLARALVPLGISVHLATDPHAEKALRAGLAACGMTSQVPLHILPSALDEFQLLKWDLSHLVVIERVGPSHTVASVRGQRNDHHFATEVPGDRHDRCHTMGMRDVTDHTRPAHLLFEGMSQRPVTIGIGDGGNEIGMGKVPWDVIRRNIPNGHVIACRVATDFLIVAGVSNWGAYALAAGIARLRGKRLDPALFEIEKERSLLQVMVEAGPLVDGVKGYPSVSVDGLGFEDYAVPLLKIGEWLKG